MFIRYETFRVYLKKYPMTSFFIGVCLVLFLWMTLKGSSESVYTLYDFGAFHAESVKEGDWYRLISSIFLHIGWMHLLMNVFFLYVFAPPVEKILGSWKFFFFFLLSGIGGNLLCLLFPVPNISAGASGSLFGLFGFFLFIILRYPYRIEKQDKQTIFILLAIDLLFTFLSPNISVLSHIGGLVFGFILSLLFVRK